MKQSKAAHQPARRRTPPDLPSQPDPLLQPEATFASGPVELLDQLITGLQLDSAVLPHLSLSGCLLDRVALPRAVIRNARWKDLRWTGCDLANAEITALNAVRVEFLDCRMTGLRLAETSCQSLLISGGDQRYAQFRFSTFAHCEFLNCDFSDADFHGADLRGCIFHDCRLLNVEMTRARLAGADLRGSNVDGMRLEPADLRGAIVDVAQALTFAPLLGIEIR